MPCHKEKQLIDPAGDAKNSESRKLKLTPLPSGTVTDLSPNGLGMRVEKRTISGTIG